MKLNNDELRGGENDGKWSLSLNEIGGFVGPVPSWGECLRDCRS